MHGTINIKFGCQCLGGKYCLQLHMERLTEWDYFILKIDEIYSL